MSFAKIALLATGVSALAVANLQQPLGHHHGSSQLSLGSLDASFKCDLPAVLKPTGDGVRDAKDIFSSKAAFDRQVRRHQAIVRVPSMSYDDLTEVNADPRWKAFGELHKVLRKTYPNVHRKAKVETVNKYGLLFTVQGSDSSLKPNLMLAHQDVVPVADESTWTHPPFDAYFDGEWLWGRGSSDDKNSLTGLMSSLEELLSQDSWKPRRTLLFAFGFDEECGGKLGAGELAKVITDRYGDDSIAAILDEGGLGINKQGNTIFALPSVMEKGHVDVWFELKVLGGHSSIPFPHTGIGIISEIVTTLEAKPYSPKLTKEMPTYGHMMCLARHEPEADKEITRLVNNDDLEGLTDYIVNMHPLMHFSIQTSQAVDMITGGQKINAMPEVITLGVNYRIAAHNSVLEVQQNIVKYIQGVVDKYGLDVHAFEDDKDFVAASPSASTASKAEDGIDYKGTLTIRAVEVTQVANITPTTGAVWDTLAGTLQHTFAFENGKVVMAPECMTGNTDTRQYTNLTKHIYRFTPNILGSAENIHTIDERVRMDDHMNVVRFYYDYIRNMDAADL